MSDDAFTKLTLEDCKKPMPRSWHGKILKVGKKDFVKISFPDMLKFWENGNDGVVETDKGWKEYKLVGNELRVLGYENT
ncbi:MAG: hypothetical protein KBD65_03105 [Candidatus Moranbacteria bacterium]|nr:hypothetical protein [Candidatus Moranbacteria bacterium]